MDRNNIIGNARKDELNGQIPVISDSSIAEDSMTFSNPLDSPCLVAAPYFAELSLEAQHSASPPIGRTNLHTRDLSISSPVNLEQSDSMKPRFDSGFSSWSGTAESQQRFFPVLMRVDSEERQIPVQPSSVTPNTPATPDLRALPCANALNEELTDRMLVREFEEMMQTPTINNSVGVSPSKPKERFKLSPNVLLKSESTVEPRPVPVPYRFMTSSRSSLQACHKHGGRQDLQLSRCRPDSAPLKPSGYNQVSDARSNDNVDPGQEGDDENEESPHEIQMHHKRMRRNTHPTSHSGVPNFGDSTVLRSIMQRKDSVSHRRGRTRAGVEPQTHCVRCSVNSGWNHASGIESRIPAHTPSIPDVIPRQLFRDPSASEQLHQVSLFQSPIFNFNPITRQRSFSYPLTPSDCFPGISPLAANSIRQARDEFTLLGSMSPNERLTMLANQMAQIGDDMDNDYCGQSSWLFQHRPHNLSGFLACVWAVSCNITAFLVLPLDYIFNLLQTITTPASWHPARRRRRTTYPALVDSTRYLHLRLRSPGVLTPERRHHSFAQDSCRGRTTNPE